MPKGQFYAIAIFVMGRLDTEGVGLKLWGRRRACSQDYPIALDPLLLEEHKPVHNFLFPFPFVNAKAVMTVSRFMFSLTMVPRKISSAPKARTGRLYIRGRQTC